MTVGASKDAKTPVPRKEGEASPATDGLLTSEDLFGDMVDAPLEETGRTRPTHAGAIRVQVAEPAAPPEERKAGPRARGAITQATDEEVAALLGAFDTPAAPASPPAAPIAAAEAVPAPPVAPAVPTPPSPARPAATERARPLAPASAGSSDDLDLDALLDRLPAAAPQATKPVASAPPGPPGPRPRWTAAPKGLPSLAVREAPSAPGLGGASPEPTAADLARPTPLPAGAPDHTEARFSVTTPRVTRSEEDRPDLDLAALAEDALSAAGSQAFQATSESQQPYGPYRLLEKIAVGGMAEVFKAKRTGVEGFEKILAVKRILPHLSDNKEFVDMFIDEAKMVAGLTHPSIVQIYDLGKIDRSYYIAMEYVHGRDLRSIMKRASDKEQRLPMDLSALVAQRVCAALEYAHRKKDDRGRAMHIVHRDVSPQNILISFEGEVKLTDFGIAKAATKASQTERGALRGKLLYMSPEQAWGKPIDRRSDVFSLGIVLYEMLTGQKPFLGQSEISILEMVRECRVAAPSSLNPRIPERLEAVVVKALDRDPDHRYQDAAEMSRDLERALPERKLPSSAELARLMEILFEPGERREAVGSEHTSGKHLVARQLEVDLPAAPQSPPRVAAQDMSIDKLLKRFGIK
jgi:serine/threonine protein kinase